MDGKVAGAMLAAVCDHHEEKMAPFKNKGVSAFSESRDMIRSGKVDAVVIATPHYEHTTIGIDALEQGLHTLVEKPISVHKADGERLIAAHRNPKQVFAAMFNQRTDPYYKKLRQLIRAGELGELRRVQWTITNWFRTEAYYRSGGWRATWAGEGGGVLLNQCPHNLDLFQWMFGMPKRVRAFCRLGRYHEIEVEDDVTAYMEFPNGATGTFITSTGEAPGTNRLEVVGEQGKVVYENDRLTFTRNEIGMSQFSATTKERFSMPPVWHVEIPLSGHGGQHVEILQNFANAIGKGEELIASARDGIHSVELGNAMLLSTFEDRTVDVPLDARRFESILKEKIASSKFVKKVDEQAPAGADDFAKSFAR
jgi:predicted dehydrogenase